MIVAYFWRRAAWNKSQKSLACSHRRRFRAKAYVIHTLLLCDWSVQRSANKPQTQKEKNVVRMSAAVALGGALRDIPKNGCEGDYLRTGSRQGRKKTFGERETEQFGERSGRGRRGTPVLFVFDVPIHPWWLVCRKSLNEIIRPVKKLPFLRTCKQFCQC